MALTDHQQAIYDSLISSPIFEELNEKYPSTTKKVLEMMSQVPELLKVCETRVNCPSGRDSFVAIVEVFLSYPDARSVVLTTPHFPENCTQLSIDTNGVVYLRDIVQAYTLYPYETDLILNNKNVTIETLDNEETPHIGLYNNCIRLIGGTGGAVRLLDIVEALHVPHHHFAACWVLGGRTKDALEEGTEDVLQGCIQLIVGAKGTVRLLDIIEAFFLYPEATKKVLTTSELYKKYTDAIKDGKEGNKGFIEFVRENCNSAKPRAAVDEAVLREGKEIPRKRQRYGVVE